MLWSPCGGCDPHLAAAVVCYLSFFLSGCSFFLYWYWLVSYRDEQNPSGSRYNADRDSDCENLDVDNPHSPENEQIENEEPFHGNDNSEEDKQVPCSSGGASLFVEVAFIEDERSGETKSSSSISGGGCDEEMRQTSQNEEEPVACSSNFTNKPSSNKEGLLGRRTTNCFTCPGSNSSCNSNLTTTISLYRSRIDSCKETLLPSCESEETQSSGGCEDDEAVVVRDSDTDNNVDIGIMREISSDQQQQDQVQGELSTPEDYEVNEDCPSKSEVSNNPYLNGDTYSQNILYGLHGVFTNLIEAVLACVFYSGLFENNLLTSLVWLVGFGTNFVVGNFLYILLLIYCTNKVKRKELWLRWALESTFNIVKDLYYLWIGAALLDHIITV